MYIDLCIECILYNGSGAPYKGEVYKQCTQKQPKAKTSWLARTHLTANNNIEYTNKIMH